MLEIGVFGVLIMLWQCHIWTEGIQVDQQKEGWNLKQIFSVLNLLGCCLWFHAFPIKIWMWTNSVYQLPSILSKGKLWNFQMGKLCILLTVNSEKWGMKMKSGGDANLPLPNFCVLPALSFHLSVFSKLYIINTPLHFLLLLCQSCRSFRNISFGGHILDLIKSGYHGWLSMMTSSEGPLFYSFLGPPQPYAHHWL